MDQSDEDFEGFLRQFTPGQPGPLRIPRAWRGPIAATAIVVLGAAVSMQLSWKRSSTPAGLTTPRRDEMLKPLSAPSRQIGPIRVGGAIRPPKKIVHVAPVYPEEAKAAGIQGIVALDIVIDKEGSVTSVQVVRSIPELDQAAIDAVEQWHFETTLLNGEPVEVEMDVVVRFTLPL
jgi:TonB family protein